MFNYQIINPVPPFQNVQSPGSWNPCEALLDLYSNHYPASNEERLRGPTEAAANVPHYFQFTFSFFHNLHLPVVFRTNESYFIPFYLLAAIPQVCFIDEDLQNGVFSVFLPSDGPNPPSVVPSASMHR